MQGRIEEGKGGGENWGTETQRQAEGLILILFHFT